MKIVFWCLAALFTSFAIHVCSQQIEYEINFQVNASELGNPLLAQLDITSTRVKTMEISAPIRSWQCSCKSFNYDGNLKCNVDAPDDNRDNSTNCYVDKISDNQIRLYMIISQAHAEHDGQWTAVVSLNSSMEEVIKKNVSIQLYLPINTTLYEEGDSERKKYYFKTPCTYPEPDDSTLNQYLNKTLCDGKKNVTVYGKQGCSYGSSQYRITCFSAPKPISKDPEEDENKTAPVSVIVAATVFIIVIVIVIVIIIIICVIIYCKKQGNICDQQNRPENSDSSPGGQYVEIPLMEITSNTTDLGQVTTNGHASNGTSVMNGITTCNGVSSNSAVDSFEFSDIRNNEGNHKTKLETTGISDVHSGVPKEEKSHFKGTNTPKESTDAVNSPSPAPQEMTVIAKVAKVELEGTGISDVQSEVPKEETANVKGITTLVENTGAVNSGSPIPQEMTVIAKGKSQLGEAGISDVQSGVPKEEKSNFKGINTPIESTDAVTSSSPAPPEVTVIAKGLQQNASHSTDLCKSGRQIGNYTTELSEGFGVKHLGHTIRTEWDAGDLSVKCILTSYCNEEDMVDNGNMGILLHEQWTQVSSEEQNKPICLSKAIVVTKDEPEVLHPECDTSDENVNSSPKKLNFFNNVLERYPTDSVQRELQRLNGTINTGSSRFRRRFFDTGNPIQKTIDLLPFSITVTSYAMDFDDGG